MIEPTESYTTLASAGSHAASDEVADMADEVPGAARPAQTLHDVSQALSWLATNRNNTEERVEWQGAIPDLIASLRSIMRAA